jgi:hypothetical protein
MSIADPCPHGATPRICAACLGMPRPMWPAGGMVPTVALEAEAQKRADVEREFAEYRNATILEIDRLAAELAAWRKATGRDDPEALDMELGRAGLDHHFNAILAWRDTAYAEIERLKVEGEAERAAHALEKRAHEHTWNRKSQIVDERDAAIARADAAERECVSLNTLRCKAEDRAERAEEERDAARIDFDRVARALGCVHEQSMGASYSGSVEDLLVAVANLCEMGAEAKRLRAILDASDDTLRIEVHVAWHMHANALVEVREWRMRAVEGFRSLRARIAELEQVDRDRAATLDDALEHLDLTIAWIESSPTMAGEAIADRIAAKLRKTANTLARRIERASHVGAAKGSNRG